MKADRDRRKTVSMHIVPPRVARALRVGAVLERRHPSEILERELADYCDWAEAQAKEVITDAARTANS
jgi:hypothetical protein